MTDRRLMKGLNKHSRTILAIVSALIGAVLGAVVQNILNSGIRLVEAIAAVLSLGIIALIVSQTVISDSHREANEEMLEQTRTMFEELRLSRAEQKTDLINTSETLVRGMKSLAAQFGLHVERLLLSDVNSMNSLEEDASAQLIYSVQEELCVLDLLSEEGRWPDEAMEEQHSNDFFIELSRIVRESDPPIIYKRIVQVADPNRSLLNAKSVGFIQHCRSMLELRELKKHRVSLRLARRHFPFKFMMMDRSRLVLQLQEYDSAGGGFKIWGEILITDPQSNLVSIFGEIWDQIDDDAETRTVTSADLPYLPLLRKDQ